MLLTAAQSLALDLKQSVMVGDKLSDIEAGVAAGVGRLVHVTTGHGRAHRSDVLGLTSRASRESASIVLAESVLETQVLLGWLGV
jgi:D-glycero-D-manno-heptose 1,7-bisphosphate phosphatase